jgi:trehalose 2-sulfotransferase
MPIEADMRRKGRRPYDLTRAEADYPMRDGPPARSLVICTQQRSGSTLLGEALHLAGGFGCPLEYFHDGFRPAFAARWNADRIDTYSAAVHRFRTDTTGTFGVKLFWRDVADLMCQAASGGDTEIVLPKSAPATDATYRHIFNVIAPLFPRPSFLYLRRRDQLRQAVSLFIADKTGTWRQYRAEAEHPLPTCDFDYIMQALARIQSDERHWRNFFRANALEPFEICYEDLQTDYAGTLNGFFLRSAQTDTKIAPPRLQKQAGAQTESVRAQFLKELRGRVERGGVRLGSVAAVV